MTHADNRAYFGYVSKEAARQRQRIAQTHEDETGLAARSAQSEPTLPPKPASRTPTKPEHPRSARIVHSETPSPPRSRFLPKCTVKKWLKCTAYFMNRGFAERSSGRKRTQSEKPCIASFFQTFAAHSPRYARFAPIRLDMHGSSPVRLDVHDAPSAHVALRGSFPASRPPSGSRRARSHAAPCSRNLSLEGGFGKIPRRTAMPQPQIGEHKKASHLSDYRFLAQGMGGGSAAEGLFESALWASAAERSHPAQFACRSATMRSSSRRPSERVLRSLPGQGIRDHAKIRCERAPQR